MDQRKLDLGFAGMAIKDDTVTDIKTAQETGGVLGEGVGRVDLSFSDPFFGVESL